jgi:hypothetical protein
VEGGLLLDVVVAQRAAILELLAGEDEALLVGRDALGSQTQRGSRQSSSKAHLLVLDLRLDVVDGVARLHLEGLFTSKGPVSSVLA